MKTLQTLKKGMLIKDIKTGRVSKFCYGYFIGDEFRLCLDCTVGINPNSYNVAYKDCTKATKNDYKKYLATLVVDTL